MTLTNEQALLLWRAALRAGQVPITLANDAGAKYASPTSLEHAAENLRAALELVEQVRRELDQ